MKTQTQTHKKHRGQSGALIIFMCFLLGIIALPMIGLFTFEVTRACAMREQLRSSCQAASLAGAARLASSDNTDTHQTHQDVIAAAVEAFRANAINEFAMNGANQVTTTDDNPAANQASIYVELLNPNSSPPNQPVAVGDPNGRIVHVVGAFGLEPAFGEFVGLVGPYTLRADGNGRVPQLDIVLCFDVSGSIDDQTPVTFLKRRWDSTDSRIKYDIIPAQSGAPTPGGMASGRAFDILGPQPTGTVLNGQYPMNLDMADQSGLDRPLHFNTGLRGTNTGAPPGNYPSGGGTGGTYAFSDMVVNIAEAADHTLQFPYTSPAGFHYPNLATIVEASRGNLEDATRFANARLDTVSELSTITPELGYQADYFLNARSKIRPLIDAQNAAKDFYTIMNTNTEANFGFVAFTTDAGTSPGDSVTRPNISSDYADGGNGSFPIPNIELDVNHSNHDTIINVIPMTVALNNTNIGDALDKAKDMLVDHHRPGAKRAIVLFTDGQPTSPGSGSHPWSHARDVAQEIKDEGIPIYTIGLAQNSEIIPGECNILNDDPSRTISYTDQAGNPQTYTPGSSNPGVSYIAGNSGKFFLVTNTANLRYTFENIARHLVQLVSVGG